MSITATSNRGLIKPTPGTESGTWGPFANASPSILDNILGGAVTIPLTASNVVLSSAQYQCNLLTFTGALSATVTVTLPAVGSFYTVQNLTTNYTTYQVILTTAAGGERIGAPWGEAVDIITDGTNVKFCGLERVGTYVDFALNSIPGWITACTVAPYIYCNGASFSSAVYPTLRNFLGSAFVPDCRARTRFSIDDGTGRITVDLSGNTIGNTGGIASVPWSSLGVPLTFYNDQLANVAVTGVGTQQSVGPNTPSETITNIPPAIITGITMIRAG